MENPTAHHFDHCDNECRCRWEYWPHWTIVNLLNRRKEIQSLEEANLFYRFNPKQSKIFQTKRRKTCCYSSKRSAAIKMKMSSTIYLTKLQSNLLHRRTVYEHALLKKRVTLTLDFRTLTNVFAGTAMENTVKQMMLSVTCRVKEMTKRTVVAMPQTWSTSLV